jgi:hypothetical protein
MKKGTFVGWMERRWTKLCGMQENQMTETHTIVSFCGMVIQLWETTTDIALTKCISFAKFQRNISSVINVMSLCSSLINSNLKILLYFITKEQTKDAKNKFF